MSDPNFKPIFWRDLFQDPDEVGESEYRAMYDNIVEAIFDDTEPRGNHVVTSEEQSQIVDMLQEFKGNAEHALEKLGEGDQDKDPDEVQCRDCDHMVRRSDPYFATPCGTSCSHCMETKHAKECGICADEFDLEDEDEP